MQDKLKLIPTTIFFDSPIMKPNGQQSQSIDILAPLESVMYIELAEKGNPHSGYVAYFNPSFFRNMPAAIKSINSAHLPKEAVEILK